MKKYSSLYEILENEIQSLQQKSRPVRCLRSKCEADHSERHKEMLAVIEVFYSFIWVLFTQVVYIYQNLIEWYTYSEYNHYT